MLLFVIVTCYRDIEAESTYIANDFSWLSRILKESCMLPLGWDECPRYNIDSSVYKYLTHDVALSVEDVIGIG